jgi:hypothetical protein
VWSELLRNPRHETQDEWILKTREALWRRLGDRFHFVPELDFPLPPVPKPERGGATGQTLQPPGESTMRAIKGKGSR